MTEVNDNQNANQDAEKMLAVANRRLIRAELHAAATKAGCCEPQQLADLLEARNVAVVDDNGQVQLAEGPLAFDSNGTPQTSVDGLVSAFVAKHRNWQKAPEPSSGKIPQADGKQKLLKDMTRKEIMALPSKEFAKRDFVENLEPAGHGSGWLEDKSEFEL